MYYLIHGDDHTSSRKFLTELTDGYKTVILEGKNLSLLQLEDHLVSTSFFAEKKAVVVERLFSNPKKKEFMSFLSNTKSETQLILWEDKKLPKISLGSLKNVTVQEFVLPTYYFQFLDSFTPTQKRKVFTLYQELLNTYAPEQLLFSLLKRIRLLVILRNGGTTEEISKMPSWMLSKLQSQARQWPQDTLLKFYETLQQAEIKLKTGRLPTDLAKHLDILILSQL